jgi:hypothetical protein
MPGPITVDDMADQVRDQLDESNTEDVTTADILQALNRGQRKAGNILAKKCEDLLIDSTSVTTTGSGTLDIPEAAYGRRIDQICVVRNGLEYPLTRVSYRDLHKYTSSSTVQVPSVYALKGRDYVVKPTPQSGVVFTVWYTKAPETLVTQQGRITSVNTASSYVLVDALGSGLTTSTDALGAFVNIVDAQTGEIKVSLQTLSLTTASKQVAFKTSGLSLSSVYNRTIATAIPSTVEVNDYVCAIQGTCVPDLPDACLDYVIQYAVYEIRRRMGEPVQDEGAMLKELEKDLESQWAGRESVRRITNKARHWNR